MATYIEEMKYLPSMTLREYYAGLAMQGMLANSYQQDFKNQNPLSYANNKEIASMAVAQADELIKALKEKAE